MDEGTSFRKDKVEVDCKLPDIFCTNPYDSSNHMCVYHSLAFSGKWVNIDGLQVLKSFCVDSILSYSYVDHNFFFSCINYRILILIYDYVP